MDAKKLLYIGLLTIAGIGYGSGQDLIVKHRLIESTHQIEQFDTLIKNIKNDCNTTFWTRIGLTGVGIVGGGLYGAHKGRDVSDFEIESALNSFKISYSSSHGVGDGNSMLLWGLTYGALGGAIAYAGYSLARYCQFRGTGYRTLQDKLSMLQTLKKWAGINTQLGHQDGYINVHQTDKELMDNLRAINTDYINIITPSTADIQGLTGYLQAKGLSESLLKAPDPVKNAAQTYISALQRKQAEHAQEIMGRIKDEEKRQKEQAKQAIDEKNAESNRLSAQAAFQNAQSQTQNANTNSMQAFEKQRKNRNIFSAIFWGLVFGIFPRNK